ncbi:MAG: flagellar hook-associated protein 3 [Pseudomonadota bacterium]
MPALTRALIDRQISQQSRLSAMIAGEQAKITSGRLSRPSDAPADWAELGTLARAASDIGAWQANIGRAQDRSAHADNILAAMVSALVRAKELLVQANGPSGNGAGKEPVAVELEALRAQLADALVSRDSEGQPLFPSGPAVELPVGTDLMLAGAPDRASISTGIATMAGAASLDRILADAISFVRTGTPAAAAAIDGVNAALDHVTLGQVRQGIASRRIDEQADALGLAAIDVSARRSELADTDVAEAITRIQQGLTTLQAARETFVRISRQTLFDLLR